MPKLTKNLILLAIAVVGVLIVVVIIFLTQLPAEKKSPETLSSEEINEVSQKALDFINKNFLGGQITASLIEATEDYGLIKMRLEVGGNELDTYLTKDGKLFFPEAISLEEMPIVQGSGELGEEASTPSTEITIPPEELIKFIQCLERADFVIYGANWCGWTNKLVTMLGGWDAVKPIYVECTENSKLCQEKGIEGYPTILIKGKEYQGGRTFEAFGGATNCQVPSGAESLNQENPSASCQ